MKINMVPVGGRIKSASVGLDVFTPRGGNFQTQMKGMRDNPSLPILSAFFPSDGNRMKQMMRGVGFYRPMLKTDQGMGGNFLPFYVDSSLEKTDLSRRQIDREEGLVIPEIYLEHDRETLLELQEAFQGLDLRKTDCILGPLLTHSREADKGRIPFFFIRPAILSSPIVFGDDMIQKITEAVGRLFNKVECLATEKAGFSQQGKFLYFLADVFVTTDGEVVVEKLHFPDVGFFMTELELESSVASEIQNVVYKIQDHVFSKAPSLIDSHVVYIITRDEVLSKSEDVLEILEIRSISRRLSECGIKVEVRSMGQVNEIPSGATCLLMNLNYVNGNATLLLERFVKKELVCYPSPYLQIASRELTGLRESIVPSKFTKKFLGLIGCNPKDPDVAQNIVSQVDILLSKQGKITSDLLYVDVNGKELVPVHRQIHHSWKRLANRVGDPNETILKINEIPLNEHNSMITSATGPRIHVFRFTFTA